MRYLILLFGLLLSFGTISGQTSRIVSGKTSFSIKYWAGTCEGTFAAPSGKVVFDPAKLGSSSIDVTVAASSFSSGVSMRDKDVKGKKYLNAAAHPQIRFVSSFITEKGGTYYAAGTLTIKGRSQSVNLPFKAAKNPDGGYDIHSSFSLNRLDYNVGNETATMKNMVNVVISAVVR